MTACLSAASACMICLVSAGAAQDTQASPAGQEALTRQVGPGPQGKQIETWTLWRDGKPVARLFAKAQPESQRPRRAGIVFAQGSAQPEPAPRGDAVEIPTPPAESGFSCAIRRRGVVFGRVFEKGADWISIRPQGGPNISPVRLEACRMPLQDGGPGLPDPLVLDDIRRAHVGDLVEAHWLMQAHQARLVHLSVGVTPGSASERLLLGLVPYENQPRRRR